MLKSKEKWTVPEKLIGAIDKKFRQEEEGTSEEDEREH